MPETYALAWELDRMMSDDRARRHAERAQTPLSQVGRRFDVAVTVFGVPFCWYAEARLTTDRIQFWGKARFNKSGPVLLERGQRFSTKEKARENAGKWTDQVPAIIMRAASYNRAALEYEAQFLGRKE